MFLFIPERANYIRKVVELAGQTTKPAISFLGRSNSSFKKRLSNFVSKSSWRITGNATLAIHHRRKRFEGKKKEVPFCELTWLMSSDWFSNICANCRPHSTTMGSKERYTSFRQQCHPRFLCGDIIWNGQFLRSVTPSTTHFLSLSSIIERRKKV